MKIPILFIFLFISLCAVPWANAELGWNAEQFEQKYGAPTFVYKSPFYAASYELWFSKGDLVYEVSFCKGKAAVVNAFRSDKQELKDTDIEVALNDFSAGNIWESLRNEKSGERNVWVQGGGKPGELGAALIHYVVKPGEKYPKAVLRITTKEFWDECKKENKESSMH